jgi:hypothetical protein
MKIAFVNQAVDSILPPYQTSVGACTYGAACCLAKFCEVIVYGLQDSNIGASTDFVERGVSFRFVPSSALGPRALQGAGINSEGSDC